MDTSMSYLFLVYYQRFQPVQCAFRQSTQISKTYEQMSLAFNRQAKTMWMVNVSPDIRKAVLHVLTHTTRSVT